MTKDIPTYASWIVPLSPDPARLLDAARQLTAVGTPEGLRRAISTAYYALFHGLAAHAADRFVGVGETTAAYAMFYRSLDHTRIRLVLVELAKSSFKTSYRRALGRTTSSLALRKFADAYLAFLELRQIADYDPSMSTPSRREVEQMIDDAGRALESFAALDPAERTEMLALMIAGTRS